MTINQAKNSPALKLVSGENEMPAGMAGNVDQMLTSGREISGGISGNETLSKSSTGITDEKLYALCRQYGEIALKYRRKFLGLLPEVYKRRLYEKKGFSSIFEFAAKLAGISEEQVRRTLNLEKKFENLPALHSVLINGEVSVNKLAKIASVATPENQEFLSNQAKLLSTRALETLARDEKFVHVNTNLSQNVKDASGQDGQRSASSEKLAPSDLSEQNKQAGFPEHSFSGKPAVASLNLSEEVQQKLLKLQQKGIDINQLILEFLENRELRIAKKKEELAEKAKTTNSPHIPVEVQNVLREEFGTKCSIESCFRDHETFHHTQRYALARNHNPKFLAPLCEEHHAIAHSIDVKVQEKKRG